MSGALVRSGGRFGGRFDGLVCPICGRVALETPSGRLTIVHDSERHGLGRSGASGTATDTTTDTTTDLEEARG